jgi:hypothetical protein
VAGADHLAGSDRVEESAREAAAGHAAGAGRADEPARGGEQGRSEEASSTGQPGDPSPPTRVQPTGNGVEPSPAARAADDWLRSAIAELDRVWGKPDALSVALPADRSEATAPAEGGTDGGALGTSVVLDLVDGDRRVASPDAERVLRGLTDRMRVHLPSRGRVRAEDPSTLRVDLPGRDRAETAAWLHPVMRDLAASVDGGAELRGARLRGTVHGTDGVTGVQLIQDIESAPVGGRSTGGRGSAGAFRIEDLAVRPGSGGRRHRRAAGSGSPEGPGGANDGDPAGSAGSRPLRADGSASMSAPSTNGAGTGGGHATTPDENDASTRRTDADTGGPDVAAPGTPGSGAAKPGASTGQGDDPDGDTTASTTRTDPSTETLGLGDLLAGAMAAYRGL